MKIALVPTIALMLFAAALLTQASTNDSSSAAVTPVLVELFTSEGCSSCPPADALLQKLDQQPIPGEQLIVLSEHVDYWNHIGWRDPYSARYYSDRQSQYGRRFGLDSVYTPQMVVDGTSEFTGSNSALAEKAFTKARGVAKISLVLSAVSFGSQNTLQAYVQTGPLLASYGVQEAEVYAAIALDHAESQVAHGENAGRKLAHTAVVRSIDKIGTLRQGQAFTQDVQLKLVSGADSHNLRVIVFVQEPGQGRVIGVAMQDAKAIMATR